MRIKCVVSCVNANGKPDFFFCVVECYATEYTAGEHYEAARALARSDGYESCAVVYDENDGPKWLFEHFVWESARVISPQEARDL